MPNILKFFCFGIVLQHTTLASNSTTDTTPITADKEVVNAVMQARIKQYNKLKIKRLKGEIKEKIEEDGEYSPELVSCYEEMGNTYFELNRYDKATEYYEKGLTIRFQNQKLLNQKQELIEALMNCGHTYYTQKKCQEALNKYQLALTEIKKLSNESGVQEQANNFMFKAYCATGFIYLQLKQYKTSIDEYLKAKDLVGKIILDESYKARLYHSLGCAYLGNSQFKEAKNYLSEASNIREAKLGAYNLDTLMSWQVLGDVYLDDHDPQKAKEYYQKVMDVAESVLAMEALTPETKNSVVVLKTLVTNNLQKAERQLPKKAKEDNLTITQTPTSENGSNQVSSEDAINTAIPASQVEKTNNSNRSSKRSLNKSYVPLFGVALGVVGITALSKKRKKVNRSKENS